MLLLHCYFWEFTPILEMLCLLISSCQVILPDEWVNWFKRQMASKHMLCRCLINWILCFVVLSYSLLHIFFLFLASISCGCVSVNVGEDCPVFDGLYEFCQLSAGGSVAAAVKLNKQASEICINWGGGEMLFCETSSFVNSRPYNIASSKNIWVNLESILIPSKSCNPIIKLYILQKSNLLHHEF